MTEELNENKAKIENYYDDSIIKRTFVLFRSLLG